MCSGMAPWGGILLKWLLLIAIVPTKMIGMITQWNFQRIVRNCAEEAQREEWTASAEGKKERLDGNPLKFDEVKRTN